MTIASTSAADFPARDEYPVAVWRLYLLRAGYLLIAGGMGSQLWSAYLDPHKPWTLSHGVMNAMLLSLVLLSILGLRYPLKMLPVLFWEMTWKAAWLLTVALPAWRSGTMNADISETTFECSLIVLFLFLMPWDYVWRNFVTAKSERLR
ncbi:MAG: hypothetical protein ACTHPD_07245 [Rhizomicrobium sp.]